MNPRGLRNRVVDDPALTPRGFWDILLSGRRKLLIKLAVVGLAVVGAAVLVRAPTFVEPEGLENLAPAAPQRCLAVFLICMALWFTNLIPPAATGLLAIGLLPVLGVLPKERAFALFGNSAVLFILGVFLLAAAMISTGLSKRVTLLALQRFDKSPGRLVVGVTVSASFMALWMPEHAVAAMIYPILVEVVDSLGLKQGARYAKKLFLGLAWGSIIGGVGTFLGGARAPVAIDLLKRHSGQTIGFLPWMVAALPVVILMTLIAVITLSRRIPDDIADIKGATRMLDERVRRLGPMSSREWRLTILGLATIVIWIGWGEQIGLAVIAVLSAVALFLLRIVDWQSVQGYVNWGVLVMYGGAVALGTALTDTRAMEWIAVQVIDPSMPRLPLIILMVVTTMALTECISNTAAVAVLLPIGYTLGAVVGINPILMTLVVTIPAGLAFILPVSSPPNAISFSAGHYSVREVVQLGWPMTVSALITLILVITIWWGPVLDINSW